MANEKQIVDGDQREKLLNRMRALIAMRDGKAGSPEEASNAAERLREMLEKYHLNETEARADEPAAHVEEAVDYAALDEAAAREWMPEWTRHLACTIASNFFCMGMLVTSPHSSTVWLVGRKMDRLAVAYLTRYLQRELLRLGEVAYATQGSPTTGGLFDFDEVVEEADTTTPRGEWLAGFYQGAIDKLGERFYESRAKELLSGSNDPASVALRHMREERWRAVYKYANQKWPTMTYGDAPRRVENRGTRAGRVAGTVLNIGGNKRLA